MWLSSGSTLLAQILAKAGVDIDDVFDAVEAWLAGDRRMWLRPADDRTTGVRYVLMWTRTDSGGGLGIVARVKGPDLYICGAYYLDSEQTAELAKWEETRND